MSETDESRWRRIRDAWLTYEFNGAGAFDWDYDSRDLMRELVTEAEYEAFQPTDSGSTA